jgi:hypothetical protein
MGPNTSDAVQEMQKQVSIVVTEIGHEYTRTFAEAADGKESPRGKQATTILSAT